MQDDPGQRPPQRRLRVLIADDAPRSRNGLRALLATARLYPKAAPPSGGSSGHAAGGPLSGQAWPEVEVVGEAADGREAVRLVEEHRPDTVLMDARMPAVNGLEATRLIKSRWPETRVVVLSIYPVYRAAALAAGADKFLVKGCPADDLLSAVLDA
jgi:DNA-binding NarL/FixJ family response regulator